MDLILFLWGNYDHFLLGVLIGTCLKLKLEVR